MCYIINFYNHFAHHIDDTYDGDNDDEEKKKEGDTQSRGVD